MLEADAIFHKTISPYNTWTYKLQNIPHETNIKNEYSETFDTAKDTLIKNPTLTGYF